MDDQTLPQKAIALALKQEWNEAIAINEAILKKNAKDIETLLRLAFAYGKTGKTKDAKSTYEKILSIDRYNQIAQKNLKKLTTLKKGAANEAVLTTISPLMFLEEPGKTKFVDCTNVASPNVLSSLTSGQEVLLKPKNHCVEVRGTDTTYLAALPDDVSFKLLKFISGGNTYQAIVKSIGKNTLRILIRELTRGKRFANQPSFTSTTSYVPFTRGIAQNERPDMTATGEETDDMPPEEE